VRGTRLDSWKEIAAYLKRDIRTAQRWEKLEGLPVRRHQHDERGTAYAYSGEIDRWLEARTLRVNAPVEPVPEGVRAPAKPWRGRSAVVIGGIVVIILALGSAAFARWWRPAPARLTTLSVVFPAGERFPDWGPSLVLSPDAQTIAYSGRGPIKLRRLDQLDATLLPAVPGGHSPFYSPDGSWVGFFGPGKIFKVPTGGGTPEEITTLDVEFIGSADWGAHGEIVFATPSPAGSHQLLRVSSNGGRPAVIAALDGQAEPAYWLTPQWIDGGRHVLSTVARSTASGTSFDVVLVSVATGHARLLLNDARHARVIDDLLMYWRDNVLFGVRFDPDRLESLGPHVAVRENVGARVRLPSWAAVGDTLVYWPSVRSTRPLLSVARSGREEAIALPPADYQSPRLSPDGSRLLVIKGNVSSEFGDVWQHHLATGANTRITHGDRSGAATWTPDGAHVVVSMREGGFTSLYRVRADGTGAPERLVPGDFLKGALMQPVGWADHRTLVVSQHGMTHAARFWTVPLDGSSRPRPIIEDRTAYSGAVSPDGQWLAYGSTASGRSEVHVARLPDGQPTWQVSTGGGFPLWSKNGRELFYRNGNRLMAVDATIHGRTFAAGPPRHLFDRDLYEVEPGEPHYDVGLDGRFFIVPRGRADGPERLNVIQGWRSDIERRLAAAR
jgi:serine/threonine-protein kinase